MTDSIYCDYVYPDGEPCEEVAVEVGMCRDHFQGEINRRAAVACCLRGHDYFPPSDPFRPVYCIRCGEQDPRTIAR